MRVSSNLATQLLEAAAARGIYREPILAGVSPMARAALMNLATEVEWDLITELCASVFSLVDHDAERMRAVGRALVHAPSYSVLRRLAHTVVSMRALYEMANRWVAPA